MSKLFVRLARNVQEAAANAAWIQWQALGAQAAASRSPQSIVDPEALVLFSLWLADEEARLRDFLFGFGELGSRLLSVQRMKRAAAFFPTGKVGGLAGFAASVASFGKDPRWGGLAEAGRELQGRPGKVIAVTRGLGEPGSLMVRLRTGFGVDVRTDVLSYLIGRREAWADVKEISEALLYAKYSVRQACGALADARLIELDPGRPARYYADGDRWLALLQLKAIPSWYPWMGVYAFVVSLLEWLRASGAEATSDSLAASLAREFMMNHAHILLKVQLDVPHEKDYAGEAYLTAFDETVSALVRWLNAAS